MSHRFGIFVVVFCAAVLDTAIAQLGMWQNLPLTCLSCSNEECQKPVSKTTPCKDNSDVCATIFKDEKTVLYRGCSSNVPKELYQYCPKGCFPCTSNKCNIATSTKDYIECISCNTFYSPNCLTNIEKVGGIKKCYKSCMVALYADSEGPDPNYELIRTCLDDKEEQDRKECEEGSSKCKSCTGAKCNHFILPENRLKCYDCQEPNCKDAKPSVCAVHNEKDQCTYKFHTSGALESAQCKSKLNPAVASDLMMKNQLTVCSGSECNSLKNLPKPQHCLKCNSISDPLCATNPDQLSAKSVKLCNKMPNTNCYIRVQDGITTRGCVSDLDNLDRVLCDLNKNKNCRTCTGDNCNKEVFPSNRLRCFRCDSAGDTSCESAPKKDLLSVCPKYVEGDSCVVQYSDKKITRRDCMSELPCDGKDNKKCRICTDSACNTVDLKKENSAMGIYLAIGALLAMTSHLAV